jgi:hypothetical protein
MDIEKDLRSALARREPSADFAEAVVARVRAQATAETRRRAPVWRVPAALAATVLAAVVGLHWHAERQRAAESRDQLLIALAITSHQLDQVQQKLVRTEPTNAEENGS